METTHANQQSGNPRPRDAQPHAWGPALEHLYRAHYGRLVDVAHRIVRDRSLAEECVQEVFIAYHCKRPLHDASRTGAYLRTMTRNAAISMVRVEARQRREVVPISRPSPPAEDEAIARVASEELEASIVQLSRRQQQVIACRRCGLSVDETAEVLDITAGSVKTHRHRAATAIAANPIAA